METVQIVTRCIDCAYRTAEGTHCHWDAAYRRITFDGFCAWGSDDSREKQAYREKFPQVFDWGGRFVKDKEWWERYVELHDPRKPGYKKEQPADSDES